MLGSERRDENLSIDHEGGYEDAVYNDSAFIHTLPITDRPEIAPLEWSFLSGKLHLFVET